MVVNEDDIVDDDGRRSNVWLKWRMSISIVVAAAELFLLLLLIDPFLSIAIPIDDLLLNALEWMMPWFALVVLLLLLLLFFVDDSIA